MIERALDDAAGRPRVWLEALEGRRMMSGAPAASTVPAVPFGARDFWTIDVQLGAGGKIYAVGELNDAGGAPKCGLERFNADGSPDLSFGSDGTGTVAFDLAGGSISFAVLPEADGGCLVVGGGGGDEIPVERFTAAGVPDPDFNGGQALDLRPLTLADEGADGVISGGFCCASRTADGELSLVWVQGDDLVEERITADGRPDEAFGAGGARVTQVPLLDGLGTAYLDAAAHTPDGGLVVYGNVGSDPAFRVAIDSTGALSSAEELSAPTDRPGTPSWVTPTGDGSTALIGTFAGEVWSVNGNGAATVLASDIDAGGEAITGTPEVYPLLLPDGRVLVEVGWLSGSLVMLRADGTVDPTFNAGQPLIVGGQSWGVALADGSVMWVRSGAWQIERILPDGHVIDLSTPLPSDPTDPMAVPGEPVGGGDPAAGQARDEATAEWSMAAQPAGGADAGSSFVGLFDPAAGGTLFDPDGTSVLN